MKYKLKKETKPTLPTFGKYKAVACHYQTIESEELTNEVTRRGCLNRAIVVNVLSSLSDVIKEHLRRGDKVVLHDFGMMKLEIESDKVDDAEEFCASKTYMRRTPAFPSEERQGQSGSVSGHHV